MPATYQQHTLKDIIDKNKTGKLVLPNFQRDFVWDFDKQRRLLSSFICGLPIGSLLLLNGDKEAFSCRNLCYLGEPKHLAEECSYLLDGQQRLSSLSGYFSNLFGDSKDYDKNHDTIYNLLRYRWYIRLKPQEREGDIFGWMSLRFSESSIYKYEPNDLIDYIGAFKVYKNKKDCWWHPAYEPLDEHDKKLTPSRKREKIADLAATEGVIPLWDFFDNPDTGLHELVLRKIAEKQRHVIEACISDEKSTYQDILGHLDPDIEEKAKDGVNIEEVWMELRTNWKKEIIICIKSCIFTQAIPAILLPADEVGRAVATFSAVNEGGTRLDPYDLIVARAAKSRQETSLTVRITDLLKSSIDINDSIFGSNVGKAPAVWSFENFGLMAENTLTSAFKDIFLNALSIYVHCKLYKKEPKVEHIKIKGILELSHEEINNNAEKCIIAIKRSVNFLAFRCGMRTINELNYKLMLQPIIYCFTDDAIYNNTKHINKIEYWYWLSLFSGRYRENQNETCVEDISNLYSFIMNDDNKFEPSEVRILDYEGYSKQDVLLLEKDDIPSAIYNGVMCYILSNQPRDFLVDVRLKDRKSTRLNSSH